MAAKQEEKSRYVKLYAQGQVDEDELEIHLADLKYQVENMKLLISSVEADLAADVDSAQLRGGRSRRQPGHDRRQQRSYEGSLQHGCGPAVSRSLDTEHATW